MPEQNAPQVPTETAEGHVVVVPDQNAEPAPPPTDAEVAAEWGTFTAKSDLFYDGSRCRSKGQPVPASHPMVESWLRDGLLERVSRVGDEIPVNVPPARKPR